MSALAEAPQAVLSPGQVKKDGAVKGHRRFARLI
jgi:hypothetical protein